MEDPIITISLILAFINVVALAIGYHYKFKIIAIGLIIFDVLTIMTMIKLID
ncbi:MAG TPA: hypothetical protein VJ142_03140 [Candidatus Nanoarchaeia archaeon]|nr:hypothetical protein [Candidatus Nanoarchaeia archaeon]